MKINTGPAACAGTARLLHELKKFADLEADYDVHVAVSVTTRALQRRFNEITKADVRATFKVIRALQGGDVSIAAERNRAEADAAVAADQLIEALKEVEGAPRR